MDLGIYSYKPFNFKLKTLQKGAHNNSSVANVSLNCTTKRYAYFSLVLSTCFCPSHYVIDTYMDMIAAGSDERSGTPLSQ